MLFMRAPLSIFKRVILIGSVLGMSIAANVMILSISSSAQEAPSAPDSSEDGTTTAPELEGAPSTGSEQQKSQPGNDAVAVAARLRDAVSRIDPGAELLPNGASFTVEGVNVTLIYDVNANRMRLVSPVTNIDDIDADDLVRLMQANFDSALDARYALAQGAVWSTFIHPLSTLDLDEFASGLGQTVNLVLTYGSSYTSGALIFGGGDSNEEQNTLIEELQEKSREI